MRWTDSADSPGFDPSTCPLQKHADVDRAAETLPVAGPWLSVYKTTLTFLLDINLILQECLPQKPPLSKHMDAASRVGGASVSLPRDDFSGMKTLTTAQIS